MIHAKLGALLTAAAALFTGWRFTQPPEIAALPDARVLRAATVDGTEYRVADDGLLYRVNGGTGRWFRLERLFDPAEVERSYVRSSQTIFRVDPQSGQRFPVRTRFTEDFEGVPAGTAGLRKLIGPERGWSECTLQSPLAPEVPDYVALRKRILTGAGEFLDASVAPSSEVAHGGKQSLKCVSPAKGRSMVCSKASLTTGLVHFTGGDELWYRAWYRIAGPARPHTLVDLESDFVKSSPGIRVMLFEEGDLGVELKALEKPKWRRPAGKRVTFPSDRWVRVTWHLRLDDGPAGRIRLWQDDELLVDATGSTLPFRTAIYNSLEVGISAHSFGSRPATLFVDDVLATTEPLIPGE